MNVAILQKALITEKSMKLTENSEFTFLVDKKATKIDIAKEVSSKFNVTVLKVATINSKPKTKMQRKGKGSYQTSGFKKAIVKLQKGQKIAIFEAKSEEEVVVTSPEGEIIKEKKIGILRGTKVRVEKTGDVAPQITQRKVITGK